HVLFRHALNPRRPAKEVASQPPVLFVRPGRAVAVAHEKWPETLPLPPAVRVGATPPLQHEVHDPPRERGLHALALLVAEARVICGCNVRLRFEPFRPERSHSSAPFSLVYGRALPAPRGA